MSLCMCVMYITLTTLSHVYHRLGNFRIKNNSRKNFVMLNAYDFFNLRNF